jgi:hypothetical protein
MIFLDTETGGLDESRHPLLEVAWAVDDGDVQFIRFPHDVRQCDPRALQLNDYDERGLGDRHTWAKWWEINVFWKALVDATLCMSNPSFDERFLLAYGRANGHGRMSKVDVWKHRKVDIACMAMPQLGYDEPKGLATIVTDLNALDYEVPAPTHGAVNDVLALRAAYRALEDLAKTPQRWVTGVAG